MTRRSTQKRNDSTGAVHNQTSAGQVNHQFGRWRSELRRQGTDSESGEAMTTTPSPSPASPPTGLDHGFVLAAILIGFAYVLLISLVGYVAGKEAAGVAGVFLTALAVALLKYWERLRFQQLPSQETLTIQIASFRWGLFAILFFTYLGIGIVLGNTSDIAWAYFQLKEPEGFLQTLGSPHVWGLSIFPFALSHFLGGAACARIINRYYLGYSALISLAVSVYSYFDNLLLGLADRIPWAKLGESSALHGITSLLCLACSLAGAIASRSRVSSQSSS